MCIILCLYIDCLDKQRHINYKQLFVQATVLICNCEPVRLIVLRFVIRTRDTIRYKKRFHSVLLFTSRAQTGSIPTSLIWFHAISNSLCKSLPYHIYILYQILM